MKWWHGMKLFFSKQTSEKQCTAPRTAASSPEDQSIPSGPTCPFCGGGPALARSGKGYPFWKSKCSAIGSGSPMIQDLDEVADGILAAIGIKGSVISDQTMNVNGIVMQHFDINESLRKFHSLISPKGLEMETMQWRDGDLTVYSLWIRRRRA